MKALILIVITTVIYATVAFPQVKEGQIFSKEAINQAINTQLIPSNAQISKVEESEQSAAIESIPINKPINLHTLLMGHDIPLEVIYRLEQQIKNIGLN